MAPRIGARSSQCAGGNVLRDFGPRGGSRSISTVANQSHRSGHTQPKCVYYFQNACEAGTLVLGCLVALHLLRLDPKAAREALLRHSRRYACADQSFGQILDGFKKHFFALARVESLVGRNLLSQFLHLTKGRLALGFPQSRADVRGTILTGQLGDCVLKPPDLRLCDSVLLFVLDHFRLLLPSLIPRIPFGSPLILFTWKKFTNALPVAPSGSCAGNNSPRNRCFCAARNREKSQKTGSSLSSSTFRTSQQASKSPECSFRVTKSTVQVNQSAAGFPQLLASL